jgi:hypothetical protein
MYLKSLYCAHESSRGLISHALRLLCSSYEIHKPTFMVNEAKNLLLFGKTNFSTVLFASVHASLF